MSEKNVCLICGNEIEDGEGVTVAVAIMTEKGETAEAESAVLCKACKDGESHYTNGYTKTADGEIWGNFDHRKRKGK